MSDEQIITAAIGGHFIAENAAGRTRLAQAIVRYISGAGTRYGMDGLFLTALLHLTEQNDAVGASGLELWRTTIGSASKRDATVFDSGSGTIGTAAAQTFADPFGRGLALPSVINGLRQAHGGDVTDIGGWVSAGCATFGKILVDATAREQAVESAKGAASAAVDAAKASYDKDPVVGFINQILEDALYSYGAQKGWFDQGPPADANPSGKASGSGDAPAPTKPEETGGPKEEEPAAPPAPPEEGGGNGGGDGDDPPKESGWPNDQGYPAPDDGGGGTPWSLIGEGPLIAISRAASMVQLDANGVGSLQNIPEFISAQRGFDVSTPLHLQSSLMAAGINRPDAAHLNVLADFASRLDFQAGRIGLAPVVSTRV